MWGDLKTLAEVWKLEAAERGKFIEAYLTTTEYKDCFNIGALDHGTFPLVDWVREKTLISGKSANTATKSWFKEIRDHLDELASRRATIDGQQPYAMVLDLRVQPGGLNEALPLIKYGQDRNVIVSVKEFK